MRKGRRYVWICLPVMWVFCSTSAIAVAQQAPTPAPAANEEADHEALRRLKTAYEEAVRNNRIDALAGHFHPDFHGVMVTGRAVNSFADVQQYWRDIHGLMGEGGSYTTTLNPSGASSLGTSPSRAGPPTTWSNEQRERLQFTTPAVDGQVQKDGAELEDSTVPRNDGSHRESVVREFARPPSCASGRESARELLLGALIGADGSAPAAETAVTRRELGAGSWELTKPFSSAGRCPWLCRRTLRQTP